MEGAPLGMEERFLHFVWATKSFDFKDLKTVENIPVVLGGNGTINHDQGPDFYGARVKIGYPEFAGSVEIHLTTEDWYHHGHHQDPLYNTVVLHVVGKSTGRKVFREDGSVVPELSLEGRIPKTVVQRYQALEGATNEIPCSGSIHTVDEIVISSTLDALGVARIQKRGELIYPRLKDTIQNWQQVIWEEVAKVMGGPVNGNAFQEIARRVPVQVVSRHRNNREELEAILLGMAGVIPAPADYDPWIEEMNASWQFLSGKYDLVPAPVEIRYLRMRPGSFPPIRLSQLAGIIVKYPTLVELLMENTIKQFLEDEIVASSYWEGHVKVGKPSLTRKKAVGYDLRKSIVINALLPTAWLYFSAHGIDTFQETASEILEKLDPEDNRIVRMFGDLGIKPVNALRSQGLLELKKYHCDLRNCLNCRLGYQILTQKKYYHGIDTYSNSRDRPGSKNRTGHFEFAGSNCTGISG